MWQPVSEIAPKYSLLPLICGSFLVSFPAIIMASVIGVGCAVYLSEIASNRTREILKPTIELLAGIPSVVLGFLMLVLVASFFQDLFHTKFRLNAFVGAIGIGLATLPMIITLSEDALRAVPENCVMLPTRLAPPSGKLFCRPPFRLRFQELAPPLF